MKRFLCILLCAVMTLSLCACGTPAQTTPTPGAPETGEPSAAPAGPVELNVVTSYGGDDGQRGLYEAAVAGYEAESGNKIMDASATSNEEWKAKVMTDFETGTEPDVLFYFTGTDANAIVENNKVVSVEEIRAEYPDYADNMKDDLLPVSPADGKNYAIPVNGYWEGMFCNTKVLEDCGVAVPGADYTWDAFLADCETIKAAGYTPVAVSLQEVPHYWFEFTLYNNGSAATHLDLPAAGGDDVGMKWQSGLGDIKALYDLGYLPANTLTASDPETVQLMADGQAAFLIDGSWKISWFQENCPDHLEDFALTYVPGKGERAATDLIGGISMGYYITRKAWDDPAKRDAAIAFVEYMTSDEQVSIFSATAVTALKNGVIPADSLDSLQVSAVAMCAGATAVVPAVQDTLAQPAREDLFANVKNIVTGKTTAEAAIDHALTLN